MSQRKSEYARKENDFYETPSWVTECLIPEIPAWVQNVWEPAEGGGKIVKTLSDHGYYVIGSDITTNGSDFLSTTYNTSFLDAIITNPPFELAQEFIETAIQKMEKETGFVAMLLRCDYDHAKTRQHLFGNCPSFSKKIVLTKRIVWFPKKGASPSYNHAWYLWDHQHRGPPTVVYSPL